MQKERLSPRRLLTLGILIVALLGSCTLIPSTGRRPHHITVNRCDWTLASGYVFDATPITTDYYTCANAGSKLIQAGLVERVTVEPIP